MSVFTRSRYCIAVFLTGAAVLVLEVLATRVLAPHFGNTIFTFSSVISVILAALSLGYAVGGRLADRYPNEQLFAGIITASGVSVGVVFLLATRLLPAAALTLNLVSGPLIAAGGLFFLPAFLLGLLSPFAITLQCRATPERGVGTVSGRIFFWSTCGSIGGSLATGFFLIPHWGVQTILLGTAALLFLLGAGLLLLSGAERKTLLALGGVGLGLTPFLLTTPAELAVYGVDTRYQRIDVIDGLYDEQPVRFFLQDHAPSGAIFLHSDEYVFEVMKFADVSALFTPELRRALIIGGGAYVLPRKLLRDYPNVLVDVVEIDPALMPIAERYFDLPSDPRLTNHSTDGRRFLRTSDDSFDLIFSDVYYSLSIPSHLATAEFYQVAKEKLNANGLFMGNFIGSLSPQAGTFLLSEMRTFRAVFPNSAFFLTDPEHPTEGQNIVFLGYQSDQPLDVRAPQSSAGATPFLRTLQEKVIPTESLDLERYPLLTDDFAPVEYLIGQVVASTRASPLLQPLRKP